MKADHAPMAASHRVRYVIRFYCGDAIIPEHDPTA
jgi:hypothetical protein